MLYNRCGRSGVQLPAVSLGLWHNFGGVDAYETGRAIVRRAFDRGVTHFDLANNYGPPPGSAEENFGRMLRDDLRPYRDELVISTKAGYLMWPGPYGEWGSRKYLLVESRSEPPADGARVRRHFLLAPPRSATRRSKKRWARSTSAVRQGKALYVGLSNYSAEQTDQACDILDRLGIHCLIHQPKYSMFERWVEGGLLDVLGRARRRLHPVLAARAGTAHRSLSRRHSGGFAGRRSRTAFSKREQVTPGKDRENHSGSTNWPSAAANRSRKWRWPGCCATRASRRC